MKNKTNFFLGIFLLLICAYKLFAGIQHVYDVEFADEAMYLRFGLDLFDKIRLFWAPSYNLWYKAVSLFSTNDPVQLYYVNYVLLSILIPILLYIFLWRIKIRPVVALFVSVCVLISDYHITCAPKVYHFVALVMLFGLISLTFTRNRIIQCCILLIATSIATLARPELILLLFVFLITTIVIVGKCRQSFILKNYLWLFFAFVFTVFAMYANSLEDANFNKYNRLIWAFYDNYTIKLNSTSGTYLYWEDIAKNKFGDEQSLVVFIFKYPLIFINHIAENFLLFLKYANRNLGTYFLPQYFISFFKLSRVIVLPIFLFVFFLLLINKSFRNEILNYFKNNKPVFSTLIGVSILSIIICIVLLPRTHYFYIQTISVATIFAITLNSLIKKIHQKWDFYLSILFILISIFFTKNISSYPQFFVCKYYSSTLKNSQIYKQLIAELSAFKPNESHHIFSNIPEMQAMLSPNFKSISVQSLITNKQNFDSLLLEKNIDIIVSNTLLTKDSRLLKDKSWTNFLINYKNNGFIRKDISNSDIHIYYKINNLFP